MPVDRDPPGEPGLRERKRRETSKRIEEASIRLFLQRGYGETTIDEIADAAGISRRTFFHYFKSKDDIMLAMQSGLGDILADALREEPDDKRPFEAMRDAILRSTSLYPADNMLAIDRLMRSSETVQARKQAAYIQHERTLFAALRAKWPEPERETGLKLLAMVSIGAIRLALETFGAENGKRPLVQLLEQSFDELDRHG